MTQCRHDRYDASAPILVPIAAFDHTKAGDSKKPLEVSFDTSSGTANHQVRYGNKIGIALL